MHPTATAIITQCENRFNAHRNDCSGFVKAVSSSFGITLTGQANNIVDQISQGPWTQLQRGDGKAAKQRADDGFFIVAGLKGAAHGHVVIVVSGPLDPTHVLYPKAYWGKLNSIGAKNQWLNYAWAAPDRNNVIYAYRQINPLLPLI